jgi:hypothetical protein
VLAAVFGCAAAAVIPPQLAAAAVAAVRAARQPLVHLVRQLLHQLQQVPSSCQGTLSAYVAVGSWPSFGRCGRMRWALGAALLGSMGGAVLLLLRCVSGGHTQASPTATECGHAGTAACGSTGQQPLTDDCSADALQTVVRKHLLQQQRICTDTYLTIAGGQHSTAGTGGQCARCYQQMSPHALLAAAGCTEWQGQQPDLEPAEVHEHNSSGTYVGFLVLLRCCCAVL